MSFFLRTLRDFFKNAGVIPVVPALVLVGGKQQSLYNLLFNQKFNL